MKRNTPLITLLAGAALGAALLIASMLSTPSKAPAGYTATAPPPSATTGPATGAATVPTTGPSASAAVASPSPSPAASAVHAPARADYAGSVSGGAASVAISVHGSQVIAYLCNGSAIEAWLKGTAADGRLVMTGKNRARLSAAYGFTKVSGNVVAHGVVYRFAVPAVHKPSGLYQAIAVVRGATVKAGWIVLPDGEQVGSLEPDADSAAPSAAQAPMLDVTTGTAQDGGTVLHAVPVSGVTGSGF